MTTDVTAAFAKLRENGFKGAAKRLEDLDIPRIGHRIGVGEDELHAFMDTECRGSGFDKQGRPQLLFEPHVFYRNLPAGAKRDAAMALGIAYPNWRTGTYPSDSYPRLTRALSIDETAAIKACSWGLGQILGENHIDAGYDTPQEMVTSFCADEENHLDASVNFIIANKIDDDLRALAKLTRPTTPDDCRVIVRVYNGVGYEANKYHIRFAANHNKWRKIKDTPWSPQSTAGAPAPPATSTVANGALVAAVVALVVAVASVLGIDTSSIKAMIP
ncbi:N-acetylmuramidase domain-containing protein [Microvirga brassicacearum]|uniref:N-acetylmuramidase family protein n=1 Tax=Microvirga brassicacearum TaxID=2580413 RepID=A0A5N3PH90_9HYPH|nr:N-acetylmuramidase domain-containing protein [Microvirga brassicacearum]KAB0269080.1 N-acetylmuramidase family protein [Microvirga brassicacearum]